MSGEGIIKFSNSSVDRAAVEEMITRGDYLVIAGDEKVLASLPSGNWIAGTIPYFMTSEGGKVEQDRLYVNQISGFAPGQVPRMSLYDVNSISRIAQEAPEQGFTILILPSGSQVHLDYAQNAPDYKNMYFSPIVGWISGVHLDELSERSAKVGFGPASGMLSDTQAAAMHIPLTDQQVAKIKIINLFQQGAGSVIRFAEKGFSVTTANIGGVDLSFADYIRENKIDTRLPLVANYSGVMINVSIQEVLDDKVNLYAPVFSDVDYYFAKPVDNYVEEFNTALPAEDTDNVAFCCNCILNFLYSELEGKKTGKLTGPITFGEVGYQLLNQTMVYLTLESV
uniref:DUF6976 family protein n=1 Tax=Teredinibacter waterburyi TaxID=1500538 RepID=UPI00165F4D51